MTSLPGEEEDETATLSENEASFDGDSAFGGSDVSSTYTITSSIFRYRQENGRSYHAYKDGKYMFPNDQMEMNRLNLEHHLFLLTLRSKLALAPIGSQLHRVLDVGTGTGLWAIDFAEEHPESEVLGVDLSPVQPIFVPPNCKFEIDDVDDPWSFERPFNFIHVRMMNQALTDWPQFFQQAFNNLQSGGYLEFQDAQLPLRSDDGTLTQSSVLSRWSALILEAMRRTGRNDSVSPLAKGLMVEAGFVDVVELQFRWPTNPWPHDPHLKELGMWHEINQIMGMEAASLAYFTRVLGWTVEELGGFLAELKTATEDRSVHAYWPIYVVYGRKP